jgi:hypothetical protein
LEKTLLKRWEELLTKRKKAAQKLKSLVTTAMSRIDNSMTDAGVIKQPPR